MIKDLVSKKSRINKATAMSGESIAEFAASHVAEEPVSFHTPGHKGKQFFAELGFADFAENLVDFDITEIRGSDDLFRHEGIIRTVMDKYKAIYGSRESFLLVGGSSAGNIASILTLVSPGEKLIVAGNCHRSVFNGIALAGGAAVEVEAETVPGFEIDGAVTPERIEKAIRENPDARGVVVTSPNYYGIASDVAKIAEIVHDAGMILIVDAAHGAHLGLLQDNGLGRDLAAERQGTDLAAEQHGLAAERNGADIVVMSTHKTMASFTQSSVLNVYSDAIDLERLDQVLEMIESSSPSYILMSSLDINADIVMQHGDMLARNWLGGIDLFYRRTEGVSGLRIFDDAMHDPSKFVFAIDGLSGAEVEELLIKRNIYVERIQGDTVLALSGIGNTQEDYGRLADALKEIANHAGRNSYGKKYGDE